MILPTSSNFKQKHALKVIPTHLFILNNIFTTSLDYWDACCCLFERVQMILGMSSFMRSGGPAAKQSYGMYVMPAAELISLLAISYKNMFNTNSVLNRLTLQPRNMA